MIEIGMIPACWVRLQMTAVTSLGETFEAYAASLDIDPEADWYTPTELKSMIINLMCRLGDEHYGQCRQRIPVGASELAYRVMHTAETLSEAIDLLVSFSAKLCPTRQVQRIDLDETFILKFEVDGLNSEHAAACEMSVMLSYMFALASFVGSFMRAKKVHTRSSMYSSFMTYNKDADCDVQFAEFSGLEFDRAILSLPRRASSVVDPVGNATRWALLADKMRPIMERIHLPLMNADDLLREGGTKARRRNVATRQKCRILRKETEYTARDLEKSIKAAKAMVLIATTNKTISEIGFELGFSDERSLRRFFAETTGYTPLEYRNVYQEASASEGHNHFRAIMETAKGLRV